MELGVSYISTHIPQHIEIDMRHLKEIGCTEVLFALQENHFQTFTGALRYGARIAKDNGLKPYVVVWGYANTFGGGRMSSIMLYHVDMWRVQKNGSLLPTACLNNPKIVDKFIEFVEICRTNGYEGIFIDEPTIQTCFCTICQRMFYNDFGKEIIESEKSEEYKMFQRGIVKTYIETVCKRIKILDSTLKTITCLMPRDRQFFEAVASIPQLDVFGTDPYWLLPESNMTIEDACSIAETVKNLCKNKNKLSQIWLNCWKIPGGLEKDIYSGGKKLAEVKCDSFYTWSYRGGLGTNEESINPKVSWDNVVKLYRELSKL